MFDDQIKINDKVGVDNNLECKVEVVDDLKHDGNLERLTEDDHKGNLDVKHER